MDKISILMPTYNVEKYVEDAVNSILEQSYKNFELIIVDDCSSDNTYNILEKMAEKDERIKLYRNTENKKIAYTLNKALSYSKGNYIARMDGDDISEIDRLEKQINFLKKNHNIDLVGTGTISINENGEELNRTSYIESFESLKKIAMLSSPVLHIWLAKREVYDLLKGYREIPYVEDYDFLLRMLSLNKKFSNIDNYFGYKVRIRNGNTATSVGIKQRKAFEYCRNLYKERKKNSEDSFSLAEFNDFIKSSDREKHNYNNSIKLLNKGFSLKANNDFRWIFFIILSSIKSKYQFKYLCRAIGVRGIYFYNRFKYKIEVFFWKK
ncbi:glycosyltransferase family 2 protein [Clostridium perfringens]|nr:glycosyltransferase family 2 protein [Clostridium perfringens]ELC8463464.1 glycosyltransferase family 2 protein [Clostridium perfringens]